MALASGLPDLCLTLAASDTGVLAQGNVWHLSNGLTLTVALTCKDETKEPMANERLSTCLSARLTAADV